MTGVERDAIHGRCEKWAASFGLRSLTSVLRTVSAPAMEGLALARMKSEKSKGNLRWLCVEEVYNFFERWVAFDLRRIEFAIEFVSRLDLTVIPRTVLDVMFLESVIVSASQIDKTYAAKMHVHDSMEVCYGVERRLPANISRRIRSVALDTTTSRVAVVDETRS
jgi:hypothetical protein